MPPRIPSDQSANEDFTLGQVDLHHETTFIFSPPPCPRRALARPRPEPVGQVVDQERGHEALEGGDPVALAEAEDGATREERLGPTYEDRGETFDPAKFPLST